MKIKFEKDYVIRLEDFSPMRKNVFFETVKEEAEGRELTKLQNDKRKKLNLSHYASVSLTKKEKTVTREYSYKKIFNKGDEFEIQQGLNILVGDNGCGKSTLIKLFLKENKEELKNFKVINVDMEKANPKISTPSPEKGFTHSIPEVMNILMWNTESHGETREGVLASLLTMDFDILILDEPEQGLSLKNQKKYLDKLKGLNKIIIITTHSKIFIENVEMIFDVETMKWIDSKQYLNSINN